jgi:hypothetical protein
MKKVLALLSIAVCFTVSTAMAQGGGQQMTPEQRTAMMKDRLKDVGLTPAQMDSVVAITNDSRAAMVAMGDIPREERMEKMKPINEARNKRLEKALGADLSKKVIDALAPRQRPGGGGDRK